MKANHRSFHLRQAATLIIACLSFSHSLEVMAQSAAQDEIERLLQTASKPEGDTRLVTVPWPEFGNSEKSQIKNLLMSSRKNMRYEIRTEDVKLCVEKKLAEHNEQHRKNWDEKVTQTKTNDILKDLRQEIKTKSDELNKNLEEQLTQMVEEISAKLSENAPSLVVSGTFEKTNDSEGRWLLNKPALDGEATRHAKLEFSPGNITLQIKPHFLDSTGEPITISVLENISAQFHFDATAAVERGHPQSDGPHSGQSNIDVTPKAVWEYKLTWNYSVNQLRGRWNTSTENTGTNSGNLIIGKRQRVTLASNTK